MKIPMIQVYTIDDNVRILSETDARVEFSNGDAIYECSPIEFWKGQWGIDKKERREAAEAFYKNGVNSWLLHARNKQDALKEYQSATGIRVIQ